MTSGSSPAVDAVLEPVARTFLEAQSEEHQQQLNAGVDQVMANPYEDGRSKVAIGFPFRYDSICYATEDFLIAYYFENAAVVTVYAIVPRLKG